MRRPSPASQRAEERRGRENDAVRLNELFPDLETLKLRIEERKTGAPEPDVTHIRHIVVNRAPAIFEVGCSDRKCDGNHDLTRRVLKALKEHKERFEGHDRCEGSNADGACRLELHFVAEAHFA